MRFSDVYNSLKIPEWSSSYLHYDFVKDSLRAAWDGEFSSHQDVFKQVKAAIELDHDVPFSFRMKSVRIEHGGRTYVFHIRVQDTTATSEPFAAPLMSPVAFVVGEAISFAGVEPAEDVDLAVAPAAMGSRLVSVEGSMETIDTPDSSSNHGASGRTSPSAHRDTLRNGMDGPLPPSCEAMIGAAINRATKACTYVLHISVPHDATAEHEHIANNVLTSEVRHALLAFQRQILRGLEAAFALEIDKVTTFYIQQSQVIATACLVAIDSAKEWSTLTKSEKSSLLVVFRQVYFALEMLLQFSDANSRATANLLLKIEDTIPVDCVRAYGRAIQASLRFAVSRPNRIEALRSDMMSALVKYITCDAKDASDHSTPNSRALSLLNPQELESHRSRGVGFACAGLCGACFVLFVLIVTEFFSIGQPLLGYDADHAAYLAGVPFTFLFTVMLFSVAVMAWESLGVNFPYLLGLDPILHWTGLELLVDSLWYLLMWEICVYAFLRSTFSDLQCFSRPSSAIPTYLWLYFILPLWILWGLTQIVVARRQVSLRSFWLLRTLWRIVTAPFYPVVLADFFICDHLTSLSASLYQLQWFWCMFFSEGVTQVCTIGQGKGVFVLSVLPVFWRLLQCLRRYFSENSLTRSAFPNLVNAGKYSIAVAEIIAAFFVTNDKYESSSGYSGSVVAFYVISSLSTVYKSAWDIFVDAGILRRKDYLLPFPSTYICFSVFNLLLRLIWVPKYLLSTSARYGSAQWIFIVFALLEIARRFVWSVIRLENEQVSNPENYRVLNFAPMPRRRNVTDFFDSVEDISAKLARTDDQNSSFAGARREYMTVLTRFFGSLPESEKVEILRHAAPLLHFEGTKHEGKGGTFAQLREETKVHAFLKHIGEQTIRQYAASVGVEL